MPATEMRVVVSLLTVGLTLYLVGQDEFFYVRAAASPSNPPPFRPDLTGLKAPSSHGHHSPRIPAFHSSSASHSTYKSPSHRSLEEKSSAPSGVTDVYGSYFKNKTGIRESPRKSRTRNYLQLYDLMDLLCKRGTTKLGRSRCTRSKATRKIKRRASLLPDKSADSRLSMGFSMAKDSRQTYRKFSRSIRRESLDQATASTKSSEKSGSQQNCSSLVQRCLSKFPRRGVKKPTSHPSRFVRRRKRFKLLRALKREAPSHSPSLRSSKVSEKREKSHSIDSERQFQALSEKDFKGVHEADGDDGGHTKGSGGGRPIAYEVANLPKETAKAKTSEEQWLTRLTSSGCTVSRYDRSGKLRVLNCTQLRMQDLDNDSPLVIGDAPKLYLSGLPFEKLWERLDRRRLISAKTLEVSDANITSLRKVLQTFDLSGLRSLAVRNNPLRYLDDGMFENATLLTQLDLSHNLIGNISTSTFLGMSHLKYLFLGYNELQELAQGVFSYASNLMDLYLQNNNITKIDVRTFRGLRSLQTLNLSENYLGNATGMLKGIFKDCSGLRNLYMRALGLTTLSANMFEGLVKVTLLDLDHNDITSIKNNAFSQMTVLEILNMVNNKLTIIQANYGFPPSLRTLRLQRNHISRIDEDAFEELTLDRLGLSGNQWRCDCDLLYLISYVQRSPNQSQPPSCTTPEFELPMSKVEIKDLKCPIKKDCVGNGCKTCNRALARRSGTDECLCMEGTQPRRSWATETCHYCPGNHYKPYAGNSPCLPCSSGSTQVIGPSPVCACANGYFTHEHGDCQRCPPGTFKSFAGVGLCSNCTPQTKDQQQCRDYSTSLAPADNNDTENSALQVPDHSTERYVQIALISVTFFVLLVFILAATMCYIHRMANKQRQITRGPPQSAKNMRTSSFYTSADETPSRSIGRNGPFIKEILSRVGRGAFGQVFEAMAYLSANDKELVKVAVKMLKDTNNEEERKVLREELEQMLNLGPHPNIIGLYGSAYHEGQLCIVMEFAELGDLLSFIQNEYTCPLQSLQYVSVGSDGLLSEAQTPRIEDNATIMMFAWQIAKGMRHLEMHRFIHRDLAARNCLLTREPVAKVSDFGLSKDAYELGYYKRILKDRVPFRWLSPEALLWGQYSSKSDVWAFGILLWELYTFGGTPYHQVSTDQLRELHENGYRMPKPPACPDQMYRIMRACWRQDARQRPSFMDLQDILDHLLQKTSKREYLDLSPPGTKSANPLPLLEEDLDDRKTSVDFISRHKNSSLSGRRSSDSREASSFRTVLHEVASTSDECFPMLSDFENTSAEINSNATTNTSGFQSMTSARTA